MRAARANGNGATVQANRKWQIRANLTVLNMVTSQSFQYEFEL